MWFISFSDTVKSRNGDELLVEIQDFQISAIFQWVNTYKSGVMCPRKPKQRVENLFFPK
jgi:hypothetical protein